jgi:hypothetical protein
MIAAHAGSCCCGTFIRAGKSTITAVDVPLPPDPAVCTYSHGRWYVGGSPSHVRPRRWLRASCAAKLAGLTFQQLEDLAAERRQSLAAMKREWDRQNGRNRRSRSKSWG